MKLHENQQATSMSPDDPSPIRSSALFSMRPSRGLSIVKVRSDCREPAFVKVKNPHGAGNGIT